MTKKNQHIVPHSDGKPLKGREIARLPQYLKLNGRRLPKRNKLPEISNRIRRFMVGTEESVQAIVMETIHFRLRTQNK